MAKSLAEPEKKSSFSFELVLIETRSARLERDGKVAKSKLGQGDRAWSRRLSEASFTTLVRLAQRQLSLGQSCIVEGNWRAVNLPGIELVLRASGARAVQIWCCADPAEIVRRFTARARHAGHLDALMPRAELERAACEGPEFLELEGPCFIFQSDAPGSFDALICALQSSPL